MILKTKHKILLLLAYTALTAYCMALPKLTAYPVAIVNQHHHTPTQYDVIQEIIKQAKQANFPINTALKIAFCESSYKYNANAEHIFGKGYTAKGVYQFTNSTWKYIKAKGHQFDYKENIKQFIINYPRHSNWWECKG